MRRNIFCTNFCFHIDILAKMCFFDKHKRIYAWGLTRKNADFYDYFFIIRENQRKSVDIIFYFLYYLV
jgi:hypothetical protein